MCNVWAKYIAVPETNIFPNHPSKNWKQSNKSISTIQWSSPFLSIENTSRPRNKLNLKSLLNSILFSANSIFKSNIGTCSISPYLSAIYNNKSGGSESISTVVSYRFRNNIKYRRAYFGSRLCAFEKGEFLIFEAEKLPQIANICELPVCGKWSVCIHVFICLICFFLYLLAFKYTE